MAFNGSGTFLINTAGQPVVSGTVISSTAFNALTADLATGLSTAITKDGQTTVTANIPMSTYKFTGLGVGSAATDSANLSQVQSTVTKLLNSVSGADTITATASPTLAAYAAGQMFYFVAAGDNTTSVTLNIDALGAKAVTRDGSTALVAADIKSGEVIVVVYDGTRFQVVSQLNSAGDATFANVSITSALNVGGVATFSAGTAAAPSITTTGDTNTGIFFPAADTIAFTEGGVEAARFDSSGNLGISEGNAPTQVLSLYRAGSTQTVMSAGNTNTGLNGTLFGVDTAGNAIINQTQSLAMLFSTGNTERMRLDSSGQLGLGVTPRAWAGGYKSLDITGPGAIASTASGDTFTQVANGAWFNGTNWIYQYTSIGAARYQMTGPSGGGNHSWYVAGSGTAGNAISFTQVMTLDASGSLGIGTASPGSKLEVLGAGRFGGDSSADVLFVRGRTSDNLGFLQFTNNGGGTVYSYIGTSAVNELAFYTNGFNQRMRIDPNGNIVAGASAALATTATNGFLYVPTCAGTPTGTPTAITGMAPIVVDTTNNKLYFYSTGVWRDAGP